MRTLDVFEDEFVAIVKVVELSLLLVFSLLLIVSVVEIVLFVFVFKIVLVVFVVECAGCCH